jgi:hypothetical protein
MMKKLLFGVMVITFALFTTACVKDDLKDLNTKIDALAAAQVQGVAALQTALTATQAQLTALSAAIAALPPTAVHTTLQTSVMSTFI